MSSRLIFNTAVFALLITILLAGQFVDAAMVSVTDGDFVDDTYLFQYFTLTNTSVSGPNAPVVGDPFLTNTGWSRFPIGGSAMWTLSPPGLGIRYNGGSVESTMGFDFSGFSKGISKIEIVPSNVLFQHTSQIAESSFEDRITGQVATPAAFGTGSYTDMYEYVGEGDTSPSVLGTETQNVIDITSLLSPTWKANPTLLELKFGYDPDPVNTGNRRIFTDIAQLFRAPRGCCGTGDPVIDNNQYGFLLRVTAVPEPSSVLLLGLGAFGASMVNVRRRRRKQENHT